MKKHRFGSLLLFFLFIFTSNAFAAPLSPEQVPEPLKSWIPWVLHGEEENLCPFLSGGGERTCVWPSALNLELNDKGGSFTQSGSVFSETSFPLPGDGEHWPQDLKVDGQGVSVLEKDGVPSVLLKKGFHTVSGRFEWNTPPESLPIPVETGLLNFTLSGKKIDFPNRDKEGRLWLEKVAKESAAEDRLEVRVHRKVTDDIPLVLTTQLVLNVSGKAREIRIGKFVEDGFTPMEIKSPIPLRLEKDGSLKLQVRPGSWTVELKHRRSGSVESIAAPEVKENWPTEEIWVFEARNNLRLVTVEGAPSIDPQQTTLPDDWKGLPAYKLAPGGSLTLSVRRRGDSEPAPDQLTLSRDMWLDFNGAGFTLQDRVGGTLNRGSRMEMNPPVTLGRVSVNGRDQLITSLKKDGSLSGVEVPPGPIQLSADSRIEKRGSMTAVGWNHGFQEVSATLHLPPGWRILASSGVDHVPESWVSRWSLLDFFLVLITALAVTKLWGLRWGLLSLLMLTLTMTERDAPQWAWLAVILGVALLRLIRPGRLQKLLRLYRWGALIVLILFAVPFMVGQIRQGLYPALEHPYQIMEASGAPPVQAAGMAQKEEAPPPPLEAEAPAGGAVQDEKAMKPVAKNAPVPSMPSQVLRMKKKAEPDRYAQFLEVQQGAKVQTGPGLPLWDWNQVSLRWNGPVDKSQGLRLFLISPPANLVLAFLRVLLMAAVVFCVMDFPGRFWPAGFRGKGAATAAALILALSFSFLPSARAQMPTPEILNELKTKLLENPECFPDCAILSRMELKAAGRELLINLQASAAAETALPLPGGATEWMPQRVLLDGKGDVALQRSDEGQLWIQIPAGSHQIQMSGPLPERETVQLPLPLKPFRVVAEVQGWSLSGLSEDGEPDDVLQLGRLQLAETRSAEESLTQNLPPFARVVRVLKFGLTWEVETTVERATPQGSSIILEVPLLEGESVTSDVRVEKGRVAVNLPPNVNELSWRSVMEPREAVVLKSPDEGDWAEVWQVDASPLWHVEPEGIPAIHSDEDATVKEWRPYPGESLTLKILRPEAVPGATLTIDQSLLVLSPGLRLTEATLNLTIRSSLGGQHFLTLPAGAELQTVSINGATQPIRQDKNQVPLPIVPGTQRVELKWLMPLSISLLYRTPEVKLGSASVNSEIQMQLGNNRWVLLAGGPRMGPAVLFWSILFVLILVAWALGKVSWVPLKTYQWVLLGLGLSQVPVAAAAVVVGWFLFLGWRKRNLPQGSLWFNFRQLILIVWTLVSLAILFGAIHQGLLGFPDMQIAGNGSSASFLRWFQDRSGEILSRPWVFSLPLYTYRLAMLAWALWISWALLSWLRWAWGCFGEGGFWRSMKVVKQTPPPPSSK